MNHLRIALFGALLTFFCLAHCSTWSTTKHSGRCRLDTQDWVNFTATITVNGSPTSVSVSFHENRGYKCKRGPTDSTYQCSSVSLKAQTGYKTDYDQTQTDPAKQTKKMCTPSATVNVTRDATFEIGGSSITRSFSWTNITDCRCSSVTP